MLTRPASIPRALTALAIALPLCALSAHAGDLKSVGGEISVSLDVQYERLDPQALVLADGSYLVVWENSLLGLKARTISEDGQAGAQRDLVANDLLGEVPGAGDVVFRKHPVAVALPTGGYFLFWTEEAAYDSVSYLHYDHRITDQDVHGRLFASDGQPLGAAFRINQRTERLQRRPAAAYNPKSGEILVLWEDSNGGVYARVLSSTGVFRGPQRRLSSTELEATAPAAAANHEGTYAVVWEACCESQEEIAGRLLDEDGRPQGAEFRVNTTTGKAQRRPAVAADPWSNFLVAWQGWKGPSSRAAIFVQGIGRDGRMVGNERRVSGDNDHSQNSPSVVSSTDGNYTVAWIDWNRNFAVAFEAATVNGAGEVLSPPTRLNTRQITPQYTTSIAAGLDGNFLAAWLGFRSEEEIGVSALRLTSEPWRNRTGLAVLD